MTGSINTRFPSQCASAPSPNASTVPEMSEPTITGSLILTPGIPRRVKMS